MIMRLNIILGRIFRTTIVVYPIVGLLILCSLNAIAESNPFSVSGYGVVI